MRRKHGDGIFRVTYPHLQRSASWEAACQIPGGSVSTLQSWSARLPWRCTWWGLGDDRSIAPLHRALCRHSYSDNAFLIWSSASLVVTGGELVKKVLLVTALLLPWAAETQNPIRVAVSSTSTIDLSELRRAFHKKCPSVILNRDPSRADYALEAIGRTTNPTNAGEVSRYRFTLFNRGGNTIYSTSPYKFSNAVNNVCKTLIVHPKTIFLL
jgi:hypothetical protein